MCWMPNKQNKKKEKFDGIVCIYVSDLLTNPSDSRINVICFDNPFSMRHLFF